MNKLLIAAAAALLSAAASPVFAEDSGMSFYGNLGVTAYHVSDGVNSANLGALGGRVGARFAKYIGVEGEAGFGVNSVNVAGSNVKISSAFGGYAVGFLPVAPNADIFARVGYGHETASASGGGFSLTVGGDTVNYGGGGQYFFDDKNGMRLDYTRFQSTHSGGGGTDTFSVAYVRKF